MARHTMKTSHYSIGVLGELKLSILKCLLASLTRIQYLVSYVRKNYLQKMGLESRYSFVRVVDLQKYDIYIYI